MILEGENILLTNKHILICIEKYLINLDEQHNREFEYVKNNFCGIVLTTDILENSNGSHIFEPNVIIYLCGDIEQIYEQFPYIQNNIICVIKEFSNNYDNKIGKCTLLGIGEVPINIHNVGVYFRNLFDYDKDYFNSISNEHQFQNLTESNKLSNAFRTGIYLTKVKESIEHDEINFKLLRCSSNLNGPTDNFRVTDNEIVARVNEVSELFFKEKPNLNHVLAQIYENISDGGSEKKAKIKEHSDKTKDMPKNGLIAFCTFYKNFKSLKIKKSKTDYHDYCFNDTSVLTRIRFRLKKMVVEPSLVKQFDIILYPNSAFIISLSTNRLYTHEIIPSVLPIDKIPTRLGYVIRCSKTNAIFKNCQTYINDDSKCVKLDDPTEDEIKDLKNLYFKENMTDEKINYDKLYFSLNRGDYEKPIV
jgi:hypothetical protein